MQPSRADLGCPVGRMADRAAELLDQLLPVQMLLTVGIFGVQDLLTSSSPTVLPVNLRLTFTPRSPVTSVSVPEIFPV